MRTHIATHSLTALSIATLLALSAPALAKHKNTKLSYDDAWAVCKKFTTDGVVSWDQTSQRYARGAACMKKFGYNI